MPAATRAPKVNARMMSAATMPIVSLRREWLSEIRLPMPPPASTWMPALRAGSAAAKTCRAISLRQLAPVDVEQHLGDGGPPVRADGATACRARTG